MAAPKFDPDAYLSKKPSFDPDAYLSRKGAGPKAGGEAQTALESYGNALTFGYGPQLQAMAEPITDRIGNLVTGQNVESAPWSQMTGGGDAYVKSRDLNIKRQQQQEMENPKSALAGSVAGSINQALAVPLPGIGAASGGLLKGAATTGAKVAGLGAVQGALMNPGDVEGQVDPLQLPERGKNALKGAGIGLLTLGAGKVAGSAVNKLAESEGALKDFAQRKAFKSTGAMLKDFRKVFGQGRAAEIGDTLLDQKIVQAGDTFEDVAQKAESAREQIGSRISKTYQDVQNKISDPKFQANLRPEQQEKLFYSGFKPASDAAVLKTEIAKDLGDAVGAKTAASRAADYIDTLAQKYGDDIDITTANKIKTEIDGAINYAKRSQDLPEFQKALLKLRNTIRDKVNSQVDAIDEVVGGSAGKALKQDNKLYGSVAEAAEIAKDRIARENGNRMFGLTDTIAGSAGAAAGGIAGSLASDDPRRGGMNAIGMGLLGALGNKAARTYGNPILASGANKLSTAAKYSTAPVGRALQAVPLPNAGLLSRVAGNQALQPAFEPAPTRDEQLLMQVANRRQKNKGGL